MNQFVGFLNSLHGVKGDGLGALAERQIQSPFSEKCRVSRKIGTNIIKTLKQGEKQVYIITGHAGDGKTSILSQILQDLNMIRKGELLQEAKLCEANGISLYYVKDMSEVSPGKRVARLREALLSKERGNAAVLISNTGPLLETMEGILREDILASGKDYTEDIRRENQTILLNQLDKNEDLPITVGKYRFMLINIARINNVGFARKYIDKITAKELWTPCGECPHHEFCAIYNNYQTIRAHKERVISFVEAYYRYLYENDERLTIRKIQAQIAFSITGDLSCKQKSAYDRSARFNYNFANLFFGYRGMKKYPQALEIAAIHDLFKRELDSIALPEDYEMFVKDERYMFSDKVRELIKAAITPKVKRANMGDELEGKNESINARKALRRFYLMYGQMSAEKTREIHDCLFGDGFTSYVDLVTKSDLSEAEKRQCRDAIFDALYARNTGFLPYAKDGIPFTLHRNDGVFQSVMLVTGSVQKNKLLIRTPSVSNKFEDDDGLHDVILRFEKEQFHISLPLFLYFMQLKRGAITSVCNPALSHNLMRLETKLNDTFRNDNEDETEISLLLNTTKGPEISTFYVYRNRIEKG